MADVLTKAELVEIVAQKSGTTKAQARRTLDAIQESVIDAVADGKEVRLTNFVSFLPQERSARRISSPISGEVLDVPAMRVVKIKPLKRFRETMGSQSANPDSE